MLTAEATVYTSKASRYLKALCNHFDRKVDATYDDNHGKVQFGFAYCELDANDETLEIRIKAQSEDNFARVKHVVGDHLERFSGKDALQVHWVESE